MNKWYQWLDSNPGPVVLDGGLGFILEERGNDLGKSRLWSGKLLLTNPDELKQVGEEWLECGADIISTATYQVTTGLLQEELNLSAEEAKEAFRLSWRVLDSARCEFWRKLTKHQQQNRRYPVIAVSCGPYSAIMPNITEYSGSYNGIPVGDIHQHHLNRLQVLRSFIPWKPAELVPGTIICFETIGHTIETEVISQIMGAEDLRHIPYWISFQCKDALHIANGDLLSQAVMATLIHSRSNLVAIGINCVDAFDLQALHGVLQSTISTHMSGLGTSRWRIDTVSYPNSGERWSPAGWYWREDMRLNPTEWAQLICSSKSKIVGGCCRVGPDYIRALQEERERLTECA